VEQGIEPGTLRSPDDKFYPQRRRPPAGAHIDAEAFTAVRESRRSEANARLRPAVARYKLRMHRRVTRASQARSDVRRQPSVGVFISASNVSQRRTHRFRISTSSIPSVVPSSDTLSISSRTDTQMTDADVSLNPRVTVAIARHNRHGDNSKHA